MVTRVELGMAFRNIIFFKEELKLLSLGLERL